MEINFSEKLNVIVGKLEKYSEKAGKLESQKKQLQVDQRIAREAIPMFR